jgi:hypothetical protein
MAGMALILLSGSWTLIFLVLLMWAAIIGVPIALIVFGFRWFSRRR